MRKFIYSISLCLILLTPFLYSSELYNGVISAKQIWFYGSMAFLMLVTAIDLLFDRKPFTIQLNKIDLALLAFFTYYTIRAATTPYMPILHNQRWINWGLCVVLYFVIKRIGMIWTDGSHSRANGGQALSGNGHTIGENSHTVVIHGQTVVMHGHTSSEDESNAAQQTTTPENHLTTPDNCMAMPDAQRMTTYDSISSFIINFLILTGLVQSLWGLLQLYGFLPSFNGYFKITGTFFNPAPYAMYLAIIFPMALGKVLYYQHKQNEVTLNANPSHIFKFSNHQIFKSFKDLVFKFPYYIAFATVLAILLILPATMIRAAWLAAAIGAFVVAWPWLKAHTPLGSWRLVLGSNIKYKIIAITAALVLIGTTGTGLFYLKKDSAIGKLFIWEVTLGKIAQKPLFGHGVGRFEAEYNNWQAEYFMKHPEEMDGAKGWVAGNTKYAFNEFLEMSSEIGLIGIVLFLGLLGILVINSHSWSFGSHSLLKTTTNDAQHMTMNDNRMTTSDAQQMTINDSPALKNSIILSFVILLFISFPLYSLPTFILFSIFSAVNQANKQPIINTNTVTIEMPHFYKYAFAMLSIPMILLLSRYNYQQYTAFYYWDEADKLYSSGAYTNASNSFDKVKDPMKYNGSFLQYYGKAEIMNGNNNKGLKLLTTAKLYTSDDILYTNLGDCYKRIKSYKKAEQAYFQSIFMIPHRIYPYYLIIKLYFEAGMNERGKEMTKKLFNMPIKVNTSAIEEIKKELKPYI